MTIPVSAVPHAIIPPNAQIPPVDPKTGQWTNSGLQLLQQIVKALNGLTPTISCSATNTTNLYRLTPSSVSPVFYGYTDYSSFAFVSPFTSTGAVTATVVPNSGVADTLNVYIGNGSTQAGAGDIVINMFYLLYYVDALNGGNGGLVLK